MSETVPRNELAEWLKKGGTPAPLMALVGLSPLGKAWVLAQSYQNTAHPILAVFKDAAVARAVADDLLFFLGREAASRVHYFPPVEFDYYRGILPNPESVSERNKALFHALNDSHKRIFLTTSSAVLQKCLPTAGFARVTRHLKPNAEISRDDLIKGLLEAGYQRQPTVYDPGSFAVRGGVVDIFSPLYDKPIRAEWLGDEIEEIRFFDPKSQRSLEKVDQVSVIPVGSTLLPRPEELSAVNEKLKERLDEIEIPKSQREELFTKLVDGLPLPEWGLLFPLLSGGSSSVFDYFPKDKTIFWDGKSSFDEQVKETDLPRLLKNHELYEKAPRAIAKKDQLFLSLQDLAQTREPKQDRFFEDFSKGEAGEDELVSRAVSFLIERAPGKKGHPHLALESIATAMKSWIDKGYHIHLVCHTTTHASRMRDLFDPYGISLDLVEQDKPAIEGLFATDFRRIAIWNGFLSESLEFPDLKVVLLSEEAVFGSKKRTSRSAAWSGKDRDRLLQSFRDLKPGDFVVHKEHGIGKYVALKTMDFLGVSGDYVQLEYRDGDKLYVPVYRLNILQKYVSGENSTAAVDKLGGDRWVKAKSKARRAVAELAAEFLTLQAKRKMITAYACSPPGSDYTEFEMEFPFDETPDQLKVIEEINQDLSKSSPMDRLVCGDVGYGKTEVAMRAAFRAVLDGKQVAVLVPTTVLAFQHFETFKSRFKSVGARVEMVSRLKSAAENKKTLEEATDGKVDILIGTHRLLSSDVQFKSLALLVIDEEHRFGVVHKERLKKMSETVHVLSMTATPIPRTLNMAMSGIKEISLITTPPPDRLAVRTFVCRSADEVIAEAVTNELIRDGQIYFVHNRVESIFKRADELRALVPKLKIDVAHGQMNGDELEKKMLEFYRGEANMLMSTTIIESGLDIPRANTIIIDDAQNFGLAQLYQLRGRVGRSAVRAYCYLLIPGENLIGDDGKQRLQVIQRYTDLGSGFHIASHDLEIRGAGDLLGKDQSGHIAAVGIDMYFDLLEESIRELQGNPREEEIEPEITMKIAARFPNDYLPDISERVLIYRKLSSVTQEEEISEIETEIRDRFGSIPAEVHNLLGLMTLKLYLKRMHVLRMNCGPRKTSLQFAPSTPVSGQKIVKLIQRDKEERYSLTPDGKLVFTVRDTDWQGQLAQIRRLCEALDID